ncbi:hypothetical protein SAMN02799630_02852 [Paenibacillus sp. UNCCL117]|nr:hypothetical protein SAMN04488602_107139 [Paenibacillus sp. cl123]SFW40986.1 hypothetical protein SAMN02799630_02852 [Paenibacillus sp. UNCCL117]
MTNLSAEALSICNQHYAKNCGGCSLRPACVSYIGQGQEALDKWIDEVNRKAQELRDGGEV